MPSAIGAKRFSLTLPDATGRAVRWVVFHPRLSGRYPLVAFSSGAFSDPDRYQVLLQPIAAAGAVVIAPVPVDADVLRPTRPPSRDATWTTRVADFRAALDPPAALTRRLREAGSEIGAGRVAMGHSYGALIAQIGGGAQVAGPGGQVPPQPFGRIDAVLAWSPPGPLAGQSAASSFPSMSTPSLTITGTADVLPGFIDDWHVHLFGFRNASGGSHRAWVGQGINHYFGGSFGRLGHPSAQDRTLLRHAQTQAFSFLGQHVAGFFPCQATPAGTDETVEDR